MRSTIRFLYGLYAESPIQARKQYAFYTVLIRFRGEQPMKTREQIYAREAGSILRDISMYRVLTEEQILRLHPSKYPREQEKVRNLLAYLVKQQRAWLSEDEQYYLGRVPIRASSTTPRPKSF